MKKLHLSESEKKIVEHILQKHIPQRVVWAFGSRVHGNVKPYSDLDLAILGDAPLNLAEHADLADDFSESDLPFKVDLVDWNQIDDGFQQIIRENHLILQEKTKAKNDHNQPQ